MLAHTWSTSAIRGMGDVGSRYVQYRTVALERTLHVVASGSTNTDILLKKEWNVFLSCRGNALRPQVPRRQDVVPHSPIRVKTTGTKRKENETGEIWKIVLHDDVVTHARRVDSDDESGVTYSFIVAGRSVRTSMSKSSTGYTADGELVTMDVRKSTTERR